MEAGAELWCLCDSYSNCCFSLSLKGECATSLSRFLNTVFSSTNCCILYEVSSCIWRNLHSSPCRHDNWPVCSPSWTANDVLSSVMRVNWLRNVATSSLASLLFFGDASDDEDVETTRCSWFFRFVLLPRLRSDWSSLSFESVFFGLAPRTLGLVVGGDSATTAPAAVKFEIEEARLRSSGVWTSVLFGFWPPLRKMALMLFMLSRLWRIFDSFDSTFDNFSSLFCLLYVTLCEMIRYINARTPLCLCLFYVRWQVFQVISAQLSQIVQ